MRRIYLLLCFLIPGFAAFSQNFKIENNQLIVEQPVVFKTGSADLADGNDSVLHSVKRFLESKKYITLMRIEGHTSTDGNEANNQTLSEKRAMSVCKWLVNNGIDCKRLLPVGFGSTKPVADNSSPEGEIQNRRISFMMAMLNGKAIGGMPTDGSGKVAGDPCIN